MHIAQEHLVERLRHLLAREPVVREVSMFGGRAFMVNQKILASAKRDGHLLLRVDALQHEALLRQPGAHKAEMGRGRTMGPGWIEVAPEAIGDDASLAHWIEVAMAHHRFCS